METKKIESPARVKVFRASKRMRIKPIFLGAIFLAAGWFLLGVDRDPEGGRKIYIAWGSILFGGAAITLTGTEVFRGRPRLILSESGIEKKDPYKSSRWTWDDVGPFSVSEQRIVRNNFIYLSAFTDQNQKILNRCGDRRVPDHVDGEVLIEVGRLADGRNLEKAQKIAEEVNLWRERCRSTGSEAQIVHARDVSKIYGSIADRRYKAAILLIAPIAIVVVLFVYRVFI